MKANPSARRAGGAEGHGASAGREQGDRQLRPLPPPTTSQVDWALGCEIVARRDLLSCWSGGDQVKYKQSGDGIPVGDPNARAHCQRGVIVKYAYASCRETLQTSDVISVAVRSGLGRSSSRQFACIYEPGLECYSYQDLHASG